MEAERLLQPGPPSLHLLAATPSETCDLAWSLQRKHARTAVRFVRGAKSQTATELFDEMAAALQFPYYFGENWDALDECLNDLEWLNASGLILIFTETERLLAHEPASELSKLLGILEDAARHWASKSGEPQPFHAVFQCSVETRSALPDRFKAVGRALNRL